MEAATRWGIVSAGKISSDFIMTVKCLPETEHKVVAVAARKIESAEAYAKKFNIPTAYGSYDDLAADSNIDIVYVANIHPHHANVSKQMLRSGKHVLCEKPITMNSRELGEVLAVAKETGKFLMEGFWSRFFPVYKRLRQELADGTVGEVKVVTVDFGMDLLADEQSDKEMGRGAVLALGCYCIQFAELIFGSQRPEKIIANGFLFESGVDDTVCITLMYPGNKMAVLTTSVTCNMSQEAVIRGSKGIIKIPMMWCPNEMFLPSGHVTYDFPSKEGFQFDTNYFRSEGFQYEAQGARASVLQGHKESPVMPHQSSQTIMAIMDEVRRQIGVKYDADK